MSQDPVVVQPNDTVCFHDSITFIATVTTAGPLTYQWQKGIDDISGATDSIYIIDPVTSNSPGVYHCTITAAGIIVPVNSVQLWMKPRMFIDTLYRYNPLGCFGECKGQFKTHVSGGTPFKNDPPYIYEWNGGHSQDTIVFGLCPKLVPYTFRVTDSLGCSLDTTYFVDFLKSPKVTFEIQPDTLIYFTNPTIEVVFPDSMKKHLMNWTWDFGDGITIRDLNPVSHTYGEDFLNKRMETYSDTLKQGHIRIRLTYTDVNGCDTTILNEFTVKHAILDIPNVFTPNDDKVNDKFVIQIQNDTEKDFRKAYLANEFLVFDRWGRKVYNEVNYKSEDWDGDHLSDGTYFYILKLTGQFGDQVKKGSVAILRIK